MCEPVTSHKRPATAALHLSTWDICSSLSFEHISTLKQLMHACVLALEDEHEMQACTVVLFSVPYLPKVDCSSENTYSKPLKGRGDNSYVDMNTHTRYGSIHSVFR